MAGKTSIRMYGENSATFLIFKTLAECPGAISEVFIANLKAFGKGKKIKKTDFEDVEVWLFPNFSRGKGFGEPDVMILVDDSVFWVEVETTVNCEKRSADLKKALRQMWRFYCCFQSAINKGVKNRAGSQVIEGYTLSDNNLFREAKVKIRDHGVLGKDVRERLKKAGKDLEDHYILFTADKPVGGGIGYRKRLCEELSDLEADVGNNPSNSLELDIKLPVDRCWYLYWKGDLEGKYKQKGCPAFELEDTYVRIKRV